MQKRTSAALDYHEKELITVMAMDRLEYFDAKIVDQLHLPNLNKISKADQKDYLDQMKHRSYESEIKIKWVDVGYIVYKNVHFIKLPECDGKRSNCARDNKVEISKRKSSFSIVENNASYPLTTNVLKKQVRERPKYDDDATAFLLVSFNIQIVGTNKKNMTRTFQICIGCNYCMHT